MATKDVCSICRRGPPKVKLVGSTGLCWRDYGIAKRGDAAEPLQRKLGDGAGRLVNRVSAEVIRRYERRARKLKTSAYALASRVLEQASQDWE